MTQEQQRPCELCRNSHPEISSPQQWKSEQARELVKSLGVGEKGTVCRPCRQDVTRMAANPSHIPRWDKIRDQCCISSCNEQVYARSKMASKERMMAILREQELHYVNEVPVPTPLCRHHYHRVYNLLQPTHTNCSACGISLKHTQSRPCPQPDIIEDHLRNTISFEGHIKEGDKVCYSCYKSHLVILQETKGISRDSDLAGIITTLKQGSVNPLPISSIRELLNAALNQITISGPGTTTKGSTAFTCTP